MSENTMAAVAIGLSCLSMLISGWSVWNLRRLTRLRAYTARSLAGQSDSRREARR